MPDGFFEKSKPVLVQAQGVRGALVRDDWGGIGTPFSRLSLAESAEGLPAQVKGLHLTCKLEVSLHWRIEYVSVGSS